MVHYPLETDAGHVHAGHVHVGHIVHDAEFLRQVAARPTLEIVVNTFIFAVAVRDFGLTR